MVALPTKSHPAYILPFDVIQRRIDAKHDAARKAAHREQRRHLLQDEFVPVMPWLLKQEALYRKVMKTQPAAHHSQPIAHPTYKVYHLRRGELPHNFIGNLAWKAISFIGSFFDAWAAVRA